MTPSLKVDTVQELIALARQRTLRYGTGSAGNSLHVAGEMYKRIGLTRKK